MDFVNLLIIYFARGGKMLYTIVFDQLVKRSGRDNQFPLSITIRGKNKIIGDRVVANKI